MTTPPTTAELQALRAIARKATPGPWLQGDTDYHPDGDGDCVYLPDGRWVCEPILEESDAAHIAAFNPAVAIRLIDALLAELGEE